MKKSIITTAVLAGLLGATAAHAGNCLTFISDTGWDTYSNGTEVMATTNNTNKSIWQYNSDSATTSTDANSIKVRNNDSDTNMRLYAYYVVNAGVTTDAGTTDGQYFVDYLGNPVYEDDDSSGNLVSGVEDIVTYDNSYGTRLGTSETGVVVSSDGGIVDLTTTYGFDYRTVGETMADSGTNPFYDSDTNTAQQISNCIFLHENGDNDRRGIVALSKSSDYYGTLSNASDISYTIDNDGDGSDDDGKTRYYQYMRWNVTEA